jgi:tetratricopeptide (TPR) repeat protein
MRYRSDQHAEDWNEMERRQLLRATATTVGAILAAPPLPRADGPGVDLLDELEATTSRLRVRDHRFGTPTALVQATRHVERLTKMLHRTRADHPLRRRLTGIAGDAAQLVGWMAFDQLDFTSGGAWFQLAADLANRSRNADLIIASAALRSRIAWLQTRMPAHALRFLDDANRRVVRLQPSPAGVAYLHAHRANIWSRAGAAYQALTELDKADVALARGQGPPASSLVFLSHVNQHHLNFWRGHLCVKLGKRYAGEGGQVLGRIAEKQRLKGYLRATGELYLDLGDAARAQGDIDRAAHLGMSALQIANDTQSLRHLARTKAFHQTLPRDGRAHREFGRYINQIEALAGA